ncbi:MAG: hypothetical protein D6806_12235 [Deltaproteobacteria bacterium]|nr:MAG: hypothetical protein D6806_12235 [Deltaproteobacteria bacterium]
MITRERFTGRALVVFAFVLAAASASALAAAGSKKAGQAEPWLVEPPPKDTWAYQLHQIARWLAGIEQPHEQGGQCKPPCFVIGKIELGGRLSRGKIDFRITGSVLHEQPQRVPLFGPPHRVMLDDVKINGRPAVVGFEGANHYWVRTAERNFTITGVLSLMGEPSLTVAGPANLLSASFPDGRIAEGDRLAGLVNFTAHLEVGKAGTVASEKQPPVFQVARAIRIQKEITFEYLVTVKSGTEIPSVKLPLRYGETVLEVTRYRGWKQEGGLLVVPTRGNKVEFAVLGRMPRLGTFEIDDRSSYEWWLIESDVEHKVKVETNAKQVDSSESPIVRRLPTSRLFLLTRGQKLGIEVQPLASLRALATVISSQRRMLVWTKDGDIIAEDTIQYENNGIDYLPFLPGGVPIYLEADGEAQKLLTDDEGGKGRRLLIPLKKGNHSVRVQSRSKHSPGLFGGTFRPPVPAHDLAVSRASITVGLPEKVIPVWFSGGEGIESPIDEFDILFVAIAFIYALVAFSDRRMRAVGFVAITGLYFVVPELYFLLVTVTVAVLAVLLVWRRFAGWKRWLVFSAGAVMVFMVGAGFFGIVVGGAAMRRELPGPMKEYRVAEAKAKEAPGSRYAQVSVSQVQNRLANAPLQQVMLDGIATVKGVVPVAMPMPSYARTVTLRRELVTPERPLEPLLVYVTTTSLYPLLALWLAAVAWTLWKLRGAMARALEAAASLWKAGQQAR